MQKSRIIRNAFYTQFTVYLASFLTMTLGAVIDGVIIGRCLGMRSMAAYGLVSPLLVFFSLFGSIVATGARNQFTLLLGKGRLRDAQGIYSLSLLISDGFSLLSQLAIFLLASPLCVLLGATGNAADLLPEARGYLIGVTIGLPAMNAVQVLNNYLPIDNDRRLPLISSVVMTVTDIVLDLIVAFVLHGGVFEIGLATSLSYFAALAVLLPHFRRKNNILKFSLRKIPWRAAGIIIEKGIPIGICRIGYTVRTAFMNGMLAAASSTAAVAAYSVHREADNILCCITISMAETVAMLASVLRGEEDRPRTKWLITTSFHATLMITLSAAALCYVFAPQFVSLYLRDSAEAADMAVRAVRAYAVSLPFYGLSMIFFNYFQGIGRTWLSSLSGFLSESGFLMLSAWLLSPRFHADAVWYALPVSQVLMFAFYAVVIFAEKRRPGHARGTLLDRILLLPASFDVEPKNRRDVTIRSWDEVTALMDEVWRFCTENGCDRRKTFHITLAIEEIVGNIIEHGFSQDRRKHSIDVRLLNKGGDWILRVRDDCRIFDPVKQLKLYSDEDRLHGIGLRLIISTAKDVQYTSVLGLNNLVIRV